MPLTKELYDTYVTILNHELMPALGCTEPIAIAYAASKAASVLGAFPDKVEIECSGNIIKNVKGVIVPASGGQKGIEVAAVLGIVGGDPEKELEVLETVTDSAREKTRELVKSGFCTYSFAEDVPNLYIRAFVSKGGDSASVTITENHTNISCIEKNGEVILHRPVSPNSGEADPLYDKSKLDVRDIIEFADAVKIEDVKELLDRQIEMNTAISREGLDNPWGAQVGKTLLSVWGNDPKTRACARAAAGSDARMGGCILPVVINSGSGNQGITVSLPVLEFAEKWDVSPEKRYRALVLSNLISLHLKYFIGSLSAFCGAVSAACGAGAAITYMYGGQYPHISRTIINTLGNVGGIVCDGAKPSCAAKIASSVHAALLAHYMGIENKQFKEGEGFIEDSVEETIKNMGYIGRVGMKITDKEILNVMTGKADVDLSC